jgi:hypothetical protein
MTGCAFPSPIGLMQALHLVCLRTSLARLSAPYDVWSFAAPILANPCQSLPPVQQASSKGTSWCLAQRTGSLHRFSGLIIDLSRPTPWNSLHYRHLSPLVFVKAIIPPFWHEPAMRD